MKPTLDLYLKWKVKEVRQDTEEPWQWGIALEKDGKEILIVNKSRQEIIAPFEILDCIFMAQSLSPRDTTLHFMAPNGHKISVGVKPTQYAIIDPAFGGEAYPQWPEELEEAGIPSHPDEQVSAPPAEGWDEERKRLKEAQHTRQDAEQREWIQEDQSEN